ncbi:(2Fe-2S)-binding protein [Virgibacillus sp. W0181]|uniref:(2Fe-2S)-binding protein n=1 Tax=Virgibacillus sp. W0181 TaxID=3391581 RepID=UPI003F46056C
MIVDDLIVCRCEEVSINDIKQTVNTYKCSAREVKLRTRAGMGYCGGRTCRPAVDAILSEVTGEIPSNHIPLKVQPPVRPISMGALGGYENGK